MQKNIFLFCFTLVMATGDPVYAAGAKDIVKDEINSIYWQDTHESKESSLDWYEAVDYCNDLVLGGHSGWRLPTFDELLSIADYTRAEPAINPVFEYTGEDSYWSGTPFSATPSRAWTIDFRTGKTYYNYKRTNHTVRCVKDIRKEK